jgi:DNA-binding HxlR family transcriptional regulator
VVRPTPTTGAAAGTSRRRGEPQVALAAAHARTTLDLLSGKWVIPIVGALAPGPRRHSDLHDALGPQVSQKILTETLRRMEHSGLVSRQVRADVPPAVLYTLTDLGQSLLDPIRYLAQWAAENHQRIR